MEITRLIERCKQGDEDALAELYKAYAQRMKGVCRRYVRDEQTTEDLLHDAFLVILTSFHRLRDTTKAEAWMMAITRNVASKYKEHLKAISTMSIEDANVADWLAEECEERNVRGVPLDEMMKMVERLPKGYGKVFQLSVFEGMSHREIADVLSIEPHSSSSQLARAKRMLRSMMQSRWSLLLLLLLLPVALLLFRRSSNNASLSSGGVTQRKDKQQKISIPSNRVESPIQTNVVNTSNSGRHNHPFNNAGTQQHLIAYTSDSVVLNDTIPQPPALTEQTDTVNGVDQPRTYLDQQMANSLTEKSVKKNGEAKQWSFQLAYAGGFGKQNIYNQPYIYIPSPSSAQSIPSDGTVAPTIPSSIDNWSDYALYLANNPDAVSPETRSFIMRIALSNANLPGEDKILRSNHHAMPITWSLALKRKFNLRWGIETGLNYTKLSSDFEMGEDGNKIVEQQSIHYLGIPVKGLFTIHNHQPWSIYGGIGMSIEVPVHSSFRSSYFVDGSFKASENSAIQAPWQFSTSLGVGVQYQLTPSIGLFVEPSVQYFLPSGNSIETYRTEHPFMFSLPLGIRITINEK